MVSESFSHDLIGCGEKSQQKIGSLELPYYAKVGIGSMAEQGRCREDAFGLGLFTVRQDVHNIELPTARGQLATDTSRVVNRIAGSRIVACYEQPKEDYQAA